MHRLYAVPSEKLRVWSIWLSQITDEAEIWQKWLCAHIDLIIRMAENLKELEEEDVSKPRKFWKADQIRRIFAYEEDAMEEDGIEYPEGVEDFYDIEQVLADIVAGEEKSVEEKKMEKEEGDEGRETTNEKVVNETGKKTEEEKRMSGVADQPEETTNERDTITDETKDKEEEVDEKSKYLKEWPVGTQWEPFGIQEEEDRSDIIEPIEMPKSAEEMRRFLKDFTYQATIYRSYFKHWFETSEQAIKEITGRTVMPTAKLQGILNEKNLQETLRLCLSYPKDTFSLYNTRFSSPKKLAEMMALSERIGTLKFIKEMARANEKIPYFFYRKAEPDVEIAIKHDDEQVIPSDPEMEIIFGNYSSLRFNLNDKPGKSKNSFIRND
ncbi:uncharacterized protein LOC122519240 [Polistes fuscatus]|uniref:uncharacterized protein LOC122519240 n=1 Tax=Polistes fuscatus TaxID=30207 RepID=UPI001CA977D5|nr:uncharacterized protein LOC122519240 [Polistes fuscatus]